MVKELFFQTFDHPKKTIRRTGRRETIILET
jgi:hypothetical protein